MGAHMPLYENVSWAMDFQFDQTTDAKVIKLLNIVDEYSRRHLVSFADRSIDAKDVVAILDDLLAQHGRPLFLRCDNGPEFIAEVVASWAKEVGTTLWHIDPGSPWQNGKVESFNSRLRDEFLGGQLFESIKEAQLLLDKYRDEYNNFRPHSCLGYLCPRQFLELETKQQRQILIKSSKNNYWSRTFYKQAA